MAHTVFCVKLKRELPGLDEPPFDNDLGRKVYDNVSQEAWRMWTEHCKMLLNEYRLNPCLLYTSISGHGETILPGRDAASCGEVGARAARTFRRPICDAQSARYECEEDRERNGHSPAPRGASIFPISVWSGLVWSRISVSYTHLLCWGRFLPRPTIFVQRA